MVANSKPTEANTEKPAPVIEEEDTTRLSVELGVKNQEESVTQTNVNN